MEHKLGIRFIFNTISVSQSSTDYEVEALTLGPQKLSYSIINVIALASTKEYSTENLEYFRLRSSPKADFLF